MSGGAETSQDSPNHTTVTIPSKQITQGATLLAGETTARMPPRASGVFSNTTLQKRAAIKAKRKRRTPDSVDEEPITSFPEMPGSDRLAKRAKKIHHPDDSEATRVPVKRPILARSIPIPQSSITMPQPPPAMLANYGPKPPASLTSTPDISHLRTGIPQPTLVVNPLEVVPIVLPKLINPPLKNFLENANEQADERRNSRDGIRCRPERFRGKDAVDTSSKITGWFEALFRDKVRYRKFLAIKGSPAQRLVNLLQELLDSRCLRECALRQAIIATLQKLANKATVYPSSYQVKDKIIPDQQYFAASGGFGEIYKCPHRGQVVCVKLIKLTSVSDGKLFMKQFVKEAVIWAQLSHQNIVPFQGFFFYSNRPCLLSPWMSNGHIIDYLSSNPLSNRYLLIRDMAEGLHYLHSWGIVHGDLKGANVMVDDSGRACLTDFGISSVFDIALPHWTSQSTVASKGGSTRWQAPELFSSDDDKTVHNTMMSDVYAWACTCYETFTGKLPFHEILKEFNVMLRVTRDGLEPSRPPASDPTWLRSRLQEPFWDLMERCWAKAPTDRPSVKDLLAMPLLAGTLDDRPCSTRTEPPSKYRTGKRGQIILPTTEELERLLNCMD